MELILTQRILALLVLLRRLHNTLYYYLAVQIHKILLEKITVNIRCEALLFTSAYALM